MEIKVTSGVCLLGHVTRRFLDFRVETVSFGSAVAWVRLLSYTLLGQPLLQKSAKKSIPLPPCPTPSPLTLRRHQSTGPIGTIFTTSHTRVLETSRPAVTKISANNQYKKEQPTFRSAPKA